MTGRLACSVSSFAPYENIARLRRYAVIITGVIRSVIKCLAGIIGCISFYLASADIIAEPCSVHSNQIDTLNACRTVIVTRRCPDLLFTPVNGICLCLPYGCSLNFTLFAGYDHHRKSYGNCT